MKKLYCYDCDIESEIMGKKEKREYEFRGKKYTINQTVYYCPKCHTELIDNDDDFLVDVYDAYLKEYNLSFQKIIDIRKSYGLSQELFAKILSWSKKTIVRYENKYSVPQGEYLSMYCRLLKQPEDIFVILQQNKNKISKEDYKKIMQTSYFKGYKSIQALLYFIKDKSLYMTQIMKHLFACDMLSIKKYNASISNFVYCALPHGPVIDQYKSLFGYLFYCGYTDFDFDENIDKPKYIANISFDKDLFTNEELECMEYVKKTFAGKSSKQLSNWSHQFEAWTKTEISNKIDLRKYIDDFEI